VRQKNGGRKMKNKFIFLPPFSCLRIHRLFLLQCRSAVIGSVLWGGTNWQEDLDAF
jgi:hypothetical protein